ncbi:Sigma54 specific transcriptional regulator, Fis family [Desulforamulus hydrothermalis Lam5 = DSM 18033]|uniref:Sigma54 specific transcriptional regulator, Fis family n=1 Tax=Desulforamulus hydrothermalis Lam5 = DSM 18033 TaxID=1121428 RepID=K8DXD7_9FIRM|nr:Sigma54 specific transcriptional regulator, Fis family [Desulforamulus hydrothermalis Lam5 = DSM 18033]SHG88782.1 PAS domain S-box-containing protein [Desulforamulus hydrothermalis Lam5 = DSM 18033]
MTGVIILHKGFLTVKDMLYKDLLPVTPDTTIGEVREKGIPNRPVVLVVEEDKLVGVLLWKDAINRRLESDVKVRQVMKRDFSSLDEEDLEREILAFLPELRYHALVCRNRQGEVLGVLSYDQVFHDLALRVCETEARINAVVETVEEAVCIVDNFDRVVIWNSRAEELYGIKAQDIVGKPINQFFSNLVVTRVNKEWEEIRALHHQPVEGTHVLINATPVRLGPKVIGGVTAERDITEIVQLNQKLTQASTQVKRLENEIHKISAGRNPFAAIKGHHKRLIELINIARKAASTNAVILLRGESGTGKELFAKAIHEASPRSDKKFSVINCAAIPPSLFESEMFGYESGAFTGADKKGKPGVFELADGGTLFMDEIGELPPDMQVKLLRVLQDGVFYRVGGATPVKVDVRIIAATNRSLEEMMANGQFREDLYYRLNVVALEIPPLRERREDIPELVYLFLQEFSQLYQKQINKLEPGVMATFLAYAWPGNIRQLKNVIERMVILTEGDTIPESAIPETLKTGSRQDQSTATVGLASVTEQTERELIIRTLKQVNGNRSEAARMLGIPRSTLYYKMHQLGIM